MARDAGMTNEEHPMTTNDRAQLPGFTQEAADIVRRLEARGVTFRVTTGGNALGTAPNGLGTILIPRKFHGRGRTNALTSAERLLAKLPEPEVAHEVHEEERRVLRTTPYMAHKRPGAQGGIRYQSRAVVERHWTDGTVDYQCAWPGCEFTHTNPRAVSNHYGATKTHQAVGTDDASQVRDPGYTEPVLGARSVPTQARVDAVLALLAADPRAADEHLPLPDLIRLILTADMERDPLYARGPGVEWQPSTDAEIVEAIRHLVGGGQREEQLEDEVRVLREALHAAEFEVERLRGNLTALRDLLDGAA